jgi:hypothetical protein
MTAIDEHVQPVGRLLGIDHVQLAMPEGGEGAARGFYGGPLGMVEVAKPANLLARGGCWFEVAFACISEATGPSRRHARRILLSWSTTSTA